MQTSDKPSLIPVPFANSGTKNTIPTDPPATAGLASLELGFPPVTMTPISAGGIPPAGQDFNGIFNLISAASRWAQAGGGYFYDSDFSTAIGGYPKGAVLMNSAATGFWMSTVDNNTTDPDSGGANWLALPNGIASTSEAQGLTNDTHALTPKKLADAFGGSNQNLAAAGYQKLPGGLIVQWGSASSNSSGIATLTNPIAFPNSFLRGWASYQAGTLTANICNMGACTLTQSSAYICNPSGAAITGAAIIFLLFGR